ncbi:MAG TPA: YcxB family protein [bacterium]|nr:YcxB family protein [bacterium]
MPMTIEYELTESDIEEFNVQHHRLSASSKKRRLVTKWVIPLFYAIIGVYFVKNYKFIWSVVIFVVAIMWLAFYERYYYIRIRKNTHKLLLEGSNAGMLGKQSLILTEESIKIRDANGESEYKGPFIKRIVKNSKYLYLYISSIMAVIIPKNAFSSEAELEEFKERIKKFVVAGKITNS